MGGGGGGEGGMGREEWWHLCGVGGAAKPASTQLCGSAKEAQVACTYQVFGSFKDCRLDIKCMMIDAIDPSRYPSNHNKSLSLPCTKCNFEVN